jgi:uncharacterized membrane protein YeiH
MNMPAWIEYFAVAICAITAVLAAEGKRIDLFGVLVLALVTAVFAGAVVFVLLREYLPPSETHRYIGMATILLIRLAAMRWKLRLPTYRTRGSGTD